MLRRRAPRDGARSGPSTDAAWHDAATRLGAELARGDLLAASLPGRALLDLTVPADIDLATRIRVLEDATRAAIEGDLRRGDLPGAGRRAVRLFAAMVDHDPHPTWPPEVTSTQDTRNLAFQAARLVTSHHAGNDAAGFARVASARLDRAAEPALALVVELAGRLATSRLDDAPAAAGAAGGDATRAGLPATLVDFMVHTAHTSGDPVAEPPSSGLDGRGEGLAVANARGGHYVRAVHEYVGLCIGADVVATNAVFRLNAAQGWWELGRTDRAVAQGTLRDALLAAPPVTTTRVERARWLAAREAAVALVAARDVVAPVDLAGSELAGLVARALAPGPTDDLHDVEAWDLAVPLLVDGRRADLVRSLAERARALELPADALGRRPRALVLACGAVVDGSSAETIGHHLDEVVGGDDRLLHDRGQLATDASRVAELVGDLPRAIAAARLALELFERAGNVARPPILQARVDRLTARLGTAEAPPR